MVPLWHAAGLHPPANKQIYIYTQGFFFHAQLQL